ncbi:hypothetical protein LCGC14_2272760 [marine sediment metagenome]|uniref:Uncharacterized protein n=1 Tax=marine sediment metagenome TaxID=412755 RepID=A0A0F9FRN7_9ZZZZ
MSGKVSRALPGTRLVDGVSNTEESRQSGYGEDYVIPFSTRVAADEGGYFLARNTTPGTGQAGHAAPTTHDTAKPFIMLKNGAEANGKRVYLDFLKLQLTAAGTAGTVNYATHTIDKARTPGTGGVALTVVNTNLQSTLSTVLSSAIAGPVVPGESNSAEARIVAHARARTVIPVAGDVLLFNFGGGPVNTGAVMAGTTELERVIQCPPIVIGPGDSYHLVLWRASQSGAASYEIEIGFWER